MFTQTDPIGIAGGLNTYGYAGGDPINFSDPFGLCPEEQRDEDGKCPGGLSVDQWERVEAASELLDSEAGARVMELANAGKITPGALPSEVAMRTSFLFDPTRIVTNNRFGSQRSADVLFLGAGDVAFAFAHELGHQEQASSFVGKILLGFRKRFGYDSEPAADAYACSVTPHRTGLAGRRCR